MKRFTDTDKWQKPWFRKLSPILKCLWIYLCDRSDAAGVWDGDKELAEFQIGASILDWNEALSTFNRDQPRIVVLKDGSWWIPKFIEFQCGLLREDCKPHQSVITLLKKRGLWEEYLKGMERVSKEYPKGIHTLQEKDKDKEKDTEKEKDKEEGVSGEEEKSTDRSKDEAITARLNRLFCRRESTAWSENEKKAFRSIRKRPEFEPELGEIETYYTSGSQYLRRDIQTLLNNWTGEIDRARAHQKPALVESSKDWGFR